jgi:hypothetical protein
MNMIKVYLYAPSKSVLLPTVAETESGVFVEGAPLKIFDHHQVDLWKAELYKMLNKEMQVIATPEGALEPGSQILEALNLNSWASFEKEAVLFTIHKGARYITIYATAFGEDGMWSAAGMNERKFHSRAPLEVVVDAIAKDIMCHPHAHKQSEKAAAPLMISMSSPKPN